MNLAARIEGLTSKLHRTILASDQFARQCPSEFVQVGEFDLKGFATAPTVFGLTDEMEQSAQYRASDEHMLLPRVKGLEGIVSDPTAQLESCGVAGLTPVPRSLPLVSEYRGTAAGR